MKLKFFFTLSLLLGIITSAFAVTDEEMEQARAITAKNYLRWVNNGSGYLDDVKELPTSMSSLKKVLKAKELENLKKFEAVSMPKDYATWDKTKLIAYWSETFLSSPGLDPVGKGSRSRTVKHLNQIKVSAPSKETPKPEEPAKPAEDPQKNATEAQQPETPAGADATADEIAGQMAAAEPTPAEVAEQSAEALEEADAPRPKKNNGTWIYVGILVVLVIVVVVLVVYAARAMKNNDGDPDDSDDLDASERKHSHHSHSSNEDTPSYQPGDTVSRKEHEFMIERKNEKIRKVKAELDVVREENARLQAAHDALQTRLSQAQTQIESLRIALGEAEKKSDYAPAPTAPASASVSRPMRSLYLGRVNRSGLFVRADRQLNPEATVYRLDTEDGYTGSFRVVTDAEVVDRLLDSPEQWLESGCTGKDLNDTDGVSGIITESSGTAVLENGCWKMIRKAKIRYE